MAALRVYGLAAACAAVLMAGATAIGLAREPKSAGRASARDLTEARDYVFAACILDRYKGQPIAQEADAMAAGLVERGQLKGEVYPKLAALARETAPEPQTSRAGIAMKLASCQALRDDPALPARIGRILREK